MAAAAKVKLPHIIHPAHRRANTDIKLLKLTGKTLVAASNNDDLHCNIKEKILPANKKRVRPSSVPANLRFKRPQSSTKLSLDELLDVISDKLRGNGFFTMRNTFIAFDPERKGNVTREALYRILCNTLSGITHLQYTELLQKLNFCDKKVISYNEFYSQFRVAPSREPHWLDRVTNHGPRHLTADYVHSMLVARAQQCVHTLSDFLPRWRGLEGQLDSIEFRNILSTLCLPLNDEQYQKLWAKYDPTGKGFITGQQLLVKLGIQISRPNTHFGFSSQTSYDKPESPLPVDTMLPENSLKIKTTLLLNAFIEKDTTNSGKLTSGQVHSCLLDLGVRLTQEQCDHMLSRMGCDPVGMIDYQMLISMLSSTSPGGLTHSVLTDTTQEFRSSDYGRACISTPDAEATLICTLHQDFLKLVSQLRSHDPKGRGYISRDKFLNIVKGFLPSTSSHETLELLTDKLEDKDLGLIVYPKFLALFDGPPSQTNKHSSSDNNRTVFTIEDEEHIKENAIEMSIELGRLCRSTSGLIVLSFETLDPVNNDRLTRDIFQQLLFRLGFNPTLAVVELLWSKLLKNKDGSVHPQELIRHFSKMPSPPPQNGLTHKLTGNHYHMRSRYFDRDCDMVLKNLKTILTLNQSSLLTYFQSHDPNHTGLVNADIFQHVLLSFCPQLTHQELMKLTKQFQDPMSDMVNYTSLIRGLTPRQPIYKIGNDLASLLSHSPTPTVTLPQLHQPITSPPQHGLPGIKTKLQKQLQQQWTHLRRQLMRLDPQGSCHVTVKEFRQILSFFGVTLNRDDLYYILQELDPLLTGKINYVLFLQLVMGEN